MSEKNVQVLFVCIECKSDQVVNPYQSSWVQSGVDNPPCKYCGGVTIYVENPEARDSILESSDKKRGLYTGE